MPQVKTGDLIAIFPLFVGRVNAFREEYGTLCFVMLKEDAKFICPVTDSRVVHIPDRVSLESLFDHVSAQKITPLQGSNFNDLRKQVKIIMRQRTLSELLQGYFRLETSGGFGSERLRLRDFLIDLFDAVKSPKFRSFIALN